MAKRKVALAAKPSGNTITIEANRETVELPIRINGRTRLLPIGKPITVSTVELAVLDAAGVRYSKD